jgi:hypothetical protein
MIDTRHITMKAAVGAHFVYQYYEKEGGANIYNKFATLTFSHNYIQYS